MSTLPENELDLEKLFLPAWAQQEPSSAKYAKYDMPEERFDRRGDRRGPPGRGRPAAAVLRTPSEPFFPVFFHPRRSIMMRIKTPIDWRNRWLRRG